MTDEPLVIKVGDWVRFQRGQLVTGVVEYIRPRKAWQDSDTIVTDAGEVPLHMILECRSKEPTR